MPCTPAQMLEPAYLASRARLIDRKRAQVFARRHAGDVHRRGGTIYLTAADERGMMVSFIQSNYMGFGSGVVVPGYGISLQNRGHGFVARRGEPEPCRARQAALPHHHPGVPDARRPAGDELRRDGRQHAAAGPCADAAAHARARPAAAGRLRRAALALQQRARDQRRGGDAGGDGAGPDRARATAPRSSATATRTSAPASSSGASAIRRSKAMSAPAIRAATGWWPAGSRRLDPPGQLARQLRGRDLADSRWRSAPTTAARSRRCPGSRPWRAAARSRPWPAGRPAPRR